MRGYRTFNPSPHPGDLRERIRIGRTVSTVGPNGYPISRDEIIRTCWAGVDDAGTQAFRAADMEMTEDVLNFVIRHRDGKGVSVGMWVEFDGERRDIKNIGHYGYRRAYLGLKTYNQKAVSR